MPKKFLFTLDEPATALLQSAMADADAETVHEIIKGFGPLDFVGDFAIKAPDGLRLPVGTMNVLYRTWINKIRSNTEAPQWNFQDDKVWRGEEVKGEPIIKT